MLCKNIAQIGNKLYEVRKKKGLTQAQVAEKAELSDRTYADIERGSANMRVDTMLSICEEYIAAVDLSIFNYCGGTCGGVLRRLDYCGGECVRANRPQWLGGLALKSI